MTGKSWSSSSSFDYTTVKYTASGSQEWVARYNGVGNRDDMATTISVDDSANVYVTGHSGISNDAFEYATIKYSANGVELWVAHYNGQGESDAKATDLLVDGSGNVYVTGWVQGAGTSYVTIKYNSSGNQQWIASYEGLAHDSDYATKLALDRYGNVYVTGRSEKSAQDFDYVTIKYNASGIQEWLARYDKYSDYANAIAIDELGNVYVTGFSEGYRERICTTIKYIQIPVSVEEKTPSKSTRYQLSQNYPNPFNPSTTIRYAIAKPGHVTLKVFNLQGQEVATLVNENKAAGEYNIQWNPTNVSSGVYVYRLKAGEFIETKKLILLK